MQSGPNSNFDCSGPLNSQGYNLIMGPYTDCFVTQTTGDQFYVDPLLGPLSNNGGATLAVCRLIKRSMTKVSANTEQAISAQIGQPAACMIENKDSLHAGELPRDYGVPPESDLWVNGMSRVARCTVKSAIQDLATRSSC